MEKNISLKNLSLFFLLIIFTLVPGFVSAAWGLPTQPAGVPTNLEGILVNITNYVLGLITIIAVLMLIWGGVRYLTAGGDEGAVEDAKNIITQAVIGLIIAGISYAVVVVVVNTIIGGVF